MPVSMSEIMEVIHRYAPKNFVPKVGMILGSGLASLAEQITNPISIPYQAIPGLQVGGVPGHASILVLGYMNDVPVVCLRGRLHLYEGISYEPIRTLVRIVRKLGANVFIVTGAVGSMRPEVTAGEVMMITDHINFQTGNPLIGPNDETIGPRFLGLEDAYDLGLREMMQAAADKFNIPLHQGVYISVPGPSFETPAEIRAFQGWGADVVGMSVVPEVILARHCGMRVACVTVVVNLAAGMGSEKISHEGTLHYGEVGSRKLVKIVPEFIREINRSGLV